MRLPLAPLLIAAILAPSAASAANYTATFGAAPKGSFVARDVLWACTGQSCSGATDYSRPLIVCQSLVRKAGAVESFSADRRPLAAAELARCNASARGRAGLADGND